MGAEALPKDFLKFRLFGEKSGRLFSPIVEVARKNEGFMLRDVLMNPLPDSLELLGTTAICQVQMHIQEVQGLAIILDASVKYASSLKSMIGDVDVFPALNRKARKDGVAVMSLRVNGVFAVCEMWPDLISQKLKLRTLPALQRAAMTTMVAQHFLQEDHVRIVRSNDLANSSQHKALSEIKAFMNVVTQDFQGHVRPSIEKTPREVDQVVTRQLFHG